MNLDTDTLHRLQGAILKWEDILAGRVQDLGAINCQLCAKFSYQGCQGCPVRIKTGLKGCQKTPYLAWRGAHRVKAFMVIENTLHRMLAQKELDFLKSLLPR